jgi:RNA polymerase-binding transcription factor DksA
MMEGLLLLSVEGLGEVPPGPSTRETWESLEAEKEYVSREILSADAPCPPARDGMQESQASEDYAHEVEWRRRGQLEAQLRNLWEAPVHLRDGAYGRCRACGAEMDRGRLAADPAAACCLACETSTETEVVYHLM